MQIQNVAIPKTVISKVLTWGDEIGEGVDMVGKMRIKCEIREVRLLSPLKLLLILKIVRIDKCSHWTPLKIDV